MEKTKSVSAPPLPQQASLIPQIMNELWSEPRLSDAFLKGRKGWQNDLATNLSVTSNDINSAIDTFGSKKFRELVSNNPAGTSPADAAAQPVRRDFGRSMNTDALYCNTGNSCGTCRGYCSKPGNALGL